VDQKRSVYIWEVGIKVRVSIPAACPAVNLVESENELGEVSFCEMQESLG